jgi:tetratricopeptide (TPR) repeat protein
VMPLEVLMRFGHWDEILAEPAYPEHTPISRALQHYARAVAYAAKDDVPSARTEEAAFLEARTRVPRDATFGNNPASDILAVAELLMAGEVLSALKAAVQREDALRYDEPPDWIQPVRHAYGAALMQSGRFAEAEAVFREDLNRLPGNGWALYGLARSLELQKKKDEAAACFTRFDAVWRDADIKLRSACLCQPGV